MAAETTGQARGLATTDPARPTRTLWLSKAKDSKALLLVKQKSTTFPTSIWPTKNRTELHKNWISSVTRYYQCSLSQRGIDLGRTKNWTRKTTSLCVLWGFWKRSKGSETWLITRRKQTSKILWATFLLQRAKVLIEMRKFLIPKVVFKSKNLCPGSHRRPPNRWSQAFSVVNTSPKTNNGSSSNELAMMCNRNLLLMWRYRRTRASLRSLSAFQQ